LKHPIKSYPQQREKRQDELTKTITSHYKTKQQEKQQQQQKEKHNKAHTK
jgi:hypothetical protein